MARVIGPSGVWSVRSPATENPFASAFTFLVSVRRTIGALLRAATTKVVKPSACGAPLISSECGVGRGRGDGRRSAARRVDDADRRVRDGIAVCARVTVRARVAVRGGALRALVAGVDRRIVRRGRGAARGNRESGEESEGEERGARSEERRVMMGEPFESAQVDVSRELCAAGSGRTAHTLAAIMAAFAWRR